MCVLSTHWSYLQRIHNMPDVSVDDVDWDLFNHIAKSYTFNTKLFHMKFRHNLLPTGKNEHRIGRLPTAQCPALCGCSCESHWHLLECPATHRQDLWSKFEGTLDKLFETNNLDPGLRRVLQHLLLPLLPSALSPPTHTKSYQEIYDTQMQLGPCSVFMSFFTKAWVKTQKTYRELNGLSTEYHESDNDISNIGRALASHVQSLWHLRNKDVHDTTPSNHHGYRHILLQLQLQELYDKQPRMLASD